MPGMARSQTRGLGGQLPTVLGHEMVGAVAALGEGVTTDSNGGPPQEGTRVVFPQFFCCHTCRNWVGRTAQTPAPT